MLFYIQDRHAANKIKFTSVQVTCNLNNVQFRPVGRDSSVGVVTPYGLNDPGIEIFRTRLDRLWYPASFPRVQRSGRGAEVKGKGTDIPVHPLWLSRLVIG